MYIYIYISLYIRRRVYFVVVNTKMNNRAIGLTFSFSLVGGPSGPRGPRRARHIRAWPHRARPNLGPGPLGPRETHEGLAH